MGEGEIHVLVPESWNVRVAVPALANVLPDLDSAIANALAAPVAGPTLRTLGASAVARTASLGRRPRIVIAVTDVTRTCPDDHFLPPMLNELAAGGVVDTDITIIVSTGLHRASTAAEKRVMLGPAVGERMRVVDHDALNPAGLVDLGPFTASASPVGGTTVVDNTAWPVVINRTAVEADLLVATGIVEPHQYAGFSGGSKTVAIGLAGEQTIAATHRPSTLELGGVRLGQIANNPFAAAIRAIGRRAGLSFVVNVAPDGDDRPVAVAAGEPDAVHDYLAAIAANLSGVELPAQADVAIAGVGIPKDANLYQASRAVTYLHFGPMAAVRRGGVYILPATLPEGTGEGLGERRFAEALRIASKQGPAGLWPSRLVEQLRASAQPGEQRAFMVAKVLEEAQIIVVGALRPDVVQEAGLLAAPTLGAALDLAGKLARASLPAAKRGRQLELLVVPHATRTLVVPPGFQPRRYRRDIEDGRR